MQRKRVWLQWVGLAMMVIGLVLPAHAAPAQVIRRGRTDLKRMALTFDADAFSVGTDTILDTLAARRARATFFLTGTWMRNHPRLVRRMVAEGHQVASHGNTHVDFRRLTDAQIRAQLQAAETEIAKFGVRGWPYVRLPSDAYNQRVLTVLGSQGYYYISWMLDARDAIGAPKSAAYVEERVVRGLPPAQRPGAIILLHLGKPGTTKALPRILDRLAAEGFSFVTVREV